MDLVIYGPIQLIFGLAILGAFPMLVWALIAFAVFIVICAAIANARLGWAVPPVIGISIILITLFMRHH